MSAKFWSFAVAAATLMLAACGDNNESLPSDPQQSMPTDSGEMSAESVTSVPAPTAPPPAVSEDEEADMVTQEAAKVSDSDDLAAELAKLEENIGSLEQALRNKGEKMRDDLLQDLDNLQRERDRLRAKADALQSAGKDFVQDFFEGLNSKLDTLERQIEPAE